MEIPLTGDIILSDKTVKRIIKLKTDHLCNIIDLKDVKINLNFLVNDNCQKNRYATIKINSPVINEELRVFLKIREIKNINNQFSIVKRLGLFYREIEIYSSVFPKILKIEDEDIIPKFYHNENDSVLIIDDMKSKNYRAINKMHSLDLSHCIIALKTLAKFHARSIVYHKKNIETLPLIDYTRKYSNTEKIMIHETESYLRIYFNSIAHCLADSFHLIKEFETLECKKFKLIFLEMVDKFFDVVAHPNFSKLPVLCHSDLVASNLLFRYNDNNEPVTCCFVDFQFTKYSSPAYDLWGFFYMNTTKEMRNEGIDIFCKIYHETLVKILNENQINGNYLFSHHELQDMMKNERIYGLIQGILNLYREYRQELKSKYEKDYRQIMSELWMETSMLSRQNIENYRNYKKRIIDQIIELYSMVMT
ncbi:uncharacterized protein LOC122507942 [Leptopilina heterotoma]|uniref:uncharacterized protein LOC122507942 n=1 Tax=Leptopilina heterotoma TaxID=63436 RepID=UPI001CA9BDE4|nr:uncharacterized protein LOC122507942 [Leptopilina heterotoma]